MKKTTSQFSSKNIVKIINRNIQIFLVGAIAVVVLLGTFIATQLSQREQDIRDQASVSGGDVEITARQSPNPFSSDGGAGEVILSANTHGVNITAMELYFTISGTSATSPVQSVTVEAADPSRPQIYGANRITDANGNITALSYPTNSDGTTPVAFAWLLNGPGTMFSSTQPVDFARVKFNVTGPGTITFSFDDDSRASLPLQDDQNEPTDVLAHVPTMTFSSAVADQISPTVPVDNPTVTLCAQPTAPLCATNQRLDCVNTPNSPVCAQCTCVDIDNTQPTSTPSPTPVTPDDTQTPTPTMTITPTPGSGTGGTTIKYCGETCSAHADCAVNLMCYSGVCRLANNPTDRYCNSPADNGLHRVCNEYCADSRECNSGLTCYYNRCRNPRNISDQYCSEPVTYVSPRTINRTVTRTVVATATPTEIPAPTQVPIEDNTNVILPAIDPTDTPWPTFAPVSVTPEPETEEEVTLVTRIQNWLKGLLILAVLMGGAVFLLWLLPIVLKRKQDNDQPPYDQTPPSRMNGPENE